MNAPRKQKIPIILNLALVLWATCALLYYAFQYIIDFWFIKEYSFFILFSLSLIVLSLLILWTLKFRKSKLFLAIIASLVGIILSLSAAISYNNKCNEILKINGNRQTYTIIEDQKTGSTFSTCVAELTSNPKYKVKIQKELDSQELRAGDIIEADSLFSLTVDSQKANYWQNGICANARLKSFEKKLRHDIFGTIYTYRNYLIDSIREYDQNQTSEAEQLLVAIICGFRIDLENSEIYDSFKVCGLAHMVAVSGAHLSLVSALLLVFLKKLKMKKHWIIIIQSLFILCYLVCAAIPISALRAATMTYISIFAFFSKRRPAPLNALGLCIIGIIAIHPETALSVSFALSAGSTLGIILFSKLFEYWILKPAPKCPNTVTSSVSLTFAAGVCTQPLSISIFKQFPLIAPLANIICAPIFTLMCAFGMCACVFSSIFKVALPNISNILTNIAFWISGLMCQIVTFLSSIPYASIPASLNTIIAIVITLVIAVILFMIWPKNVSKQQNLEKRKIIVPITLLASAIAVFAVIFFMPKNFDTQLIMLDIGQGDSILLKSKGKNFLVDTGNQDSLLKEQLAKEKITHLDGLLITHPDDDHCGSLDVIEQLVAVDNVYIAWDLPATNNKNCNKLMNNVNKVVSSEHINRMKVGDKISIEEMVLEVIWPDKYKDEGGNCDSLCVVCNVDIKNDGAIESRVLLCGDAEQDEIKKMKNAGRIDDIDIYKCGHHGSKNAIDESDAAFMSPKISLISVGAKNRYGHPAYSTIEKLEKTGSKIYRTDQQGTITCTFTENNINITTEK